MSSTTANKRILTNKKGVTVQTLYTDKEAFDIVAQAVKNRSMGNFASDLIDKGNRYGLSEEQFWWVHKLANQQEVKIQAGNILHVFTQAALNGVSTRHLKQSFETPGGTVGLSISGLSSRHAGTIWVTDGGKYPDNKLYGKIDKAHGIFTGTDVPPYVIELIKELNDNPIKIKWYVLCQ